MSEFKPKFKFEKKLGVNEMLYGNPGQLSKAIERLLFCMKETNEFHKHDCEFFRIDFRSMSLDEQLSAEFPRDSLVLDLKWGYKDDE